MPSLLAKGTVLLHGEAIGEALILEEPISFWGGVEISSGLIFDEHHPQKGESMKEKILFLSGTKGSTAGPGALLELFYNGNGPKGIVLFNEDIIGLLAASVLEEVSDVRIPILRIQDETLEIKNGDMLEIHGEELWLHP